MRCWSSRGENGLRSSAIGIAGAADIQRFFRVA